MKESKRTFFWNIIQYSNRTFEMLLLDFMRLISDLKKTCRIDNKQISFVKLQNINKILIYKIFLKQKKRQDGGV